MLKMIIFSVYLTTASVRRPLFNGPIIEEKLGEKLIRPKDIVDLKWPLLDKARGKFILI